MFLVRDVMRGKSNPTQQIRHYRYTQFCYKSKTQVNVNYVYSNEQTNRQYQFQHVAREYYETTIRILSHHAVPKKNHAAIFIFRCLNTTQAMGGPSPWPSLRWGKWSGYIPPP